MSKMLKRALMSGEQVRESEPDFESIRVLTEEIADIIAELDYCGDVKAVLEGDKEWYKRYGMSSEDQLWYLSKRHELLKKFDFRNALLRDMQLPPFDLDTRSTSWAAKENNLILSMKSTTGPFEKAPASAF